MISDLLKTYWQQSSIIRRVATVVVVLGVTLLFVSSVVKYLQVRSIVKSYEKGIAEQQKIIDAKQKDLEKANADIQTKEAFIQRQMSAINELEKSIQESNARLLEIQNKVKVADTAYERARIERTAGATIEDACAALKKAGLECQ